MSMVNCDRCFSAIDSDEDHDCFIENPGVPTGFPERVLCERCRDREDDERGIEPPVAQATKASQATPPLDTTQASAVATGISPPTNTNDGEGQ